MNRKRVIYIGILLIVTVIVSITAFSYAFLTRIDEQHGKLNMVVGDLTYKIESNDLTNNSITLSAGEGKEIELTIKAENAIDTKYELYTNSVENVEIGYLNEEGFDESTGTISKNGTKKVKIVLENDSDTSKIIIFGVQGGFDYNNITLSSGRVAVDLGQAICNIAPGTAYEFDYTGSVQEFNARCTGLYKVELWGAQGGGDQNDIGGYGAYTSGYYNNDKNRKLYVYVGEQGQYDWVNCNPSTFNGGSAGGCMTSFVGGSGGGSTDIRLTNGNWNDFDSLKSRIMVASGGAGAIYYSTIHYSGKPGGGLTGYAGEVLNVGGSNPHIKAPAGGQTYTAASRYYSELEIYGNYYQAEYGQFGRAGDLYKNGVLMLGSDKYGSLSSGGSGGYYGGSIGVDTASYGGSGASGSSFISGYNGCNAISESSTESNIIHTNQPNHYSGKVFTNGVMIDGTGCNWSTGSATNCGANQPQPNGTNATGHSGNGYARITYLGELTVTFNAGEGTVSEPTRQVNYSFEIGALPTPTKENYVFKGWYLEDTFNTLVDEHYVVTSDTTLYAKFEIARTYLYRSGTISDLVGSFAKREGHGIEYSTSGTSVTYASTYIRINSGNGGTNNYGVGIVSNQKIDVSGYSKLCATASHSGTGCSYNYGHAQFGLGSSNTSSGNYLGQYSGIVVSGDVNTSSCIDISNYNSSYYLILHNAYSGYSDYTEVWLSNED